MYNKLFSKIVTSSVWMAPTDHRIVWVTFLALMDQDGYVAIASIANLAHTARVPMEAAKSAVIAFESPDPLDSEQEFEGRRIEKVPSGWLVLNAAKYRNMATAEKIREQNRARAADYRSRKRHASVTEHNVVVTTSEQSIAKQIRATKKRLRPTDVVELETEKPTEKVFQHWKSVHRHPKASLDKRRCKAIVEALKHYSEADLCQSISGYLHSPHHRGENVTNTVYDSLELMLRDAAHIDAGLKFASSPPTANSSVTDHNIRSLTEWVNGNESNGPGGIRSANGSHGGGVWEENIPTAHRDLLERTGDDEY